MNITKESEDYFKLIDNQKYQEGISLCDRILKDKLRLTPDSNIKKVKFSFRVNWNKIFKK